MAQDSLKQKGNDWGLPIEVKHPPNNSKGGGWDQPNEADNYTWRLSYRTPDDQMWALGKREVFVNDQTNEVRKRLRK